MTGKVRVLVVDDSLTVRQHILEVLRGDPDIEIVGEASDGQTAIGLCRSLRPDVITLDMNMPHMDGLATTEFIMGHCPTPILIVSASINRGELFRTYDALAAGAVDVLEKPKLDDAGDAWNAHFLRTVKLVSRIKVITHPRARLSGLSRPQPLATAPPPAMSTGSGVIVALGASTGGPAALVSVLRQLPRGPGVTTLVVQHIDKLFAAGFTEWLATQCGRKIETVVDGQPLHDPKGGTWMAGADTHLVVRSGVLRNEQTPPRHSCRPSVDALFESLAHECGPRTFACLLTGMGRDGASGLLAIRNAGGRTFAQDEATSVVYGMPREAALLGAAERILPLPQIGLEMAQAIGGRGS